MLGVSSKGFLKYTLLPGFKPRVKALVTSGFQHIAFYMALVYGAVRLLPPNHPYLKDINKGRFGVLHVIAEASNNLVLSKKNIDQIIVFVSMLLGMGVIIMQFALIALSLFIQPVFAQFILPANGFVVTTPAQQLTDMAGTMLDMVFGVPQMFNSCVSLMQPCLNSEGIAITSTVAGTSWLYEPQQFPMPAHLALHQVLQLYSLGLMVIAAMITIYFMATVVLETAESGTPFGKRFNKVWAPIRVVVAFGMLIPVGYGLNSAQYIVLYAAKFGSGFATNGWIYFNEILAANGGTQIKHLMAGRNSEADRLVAQPNPPEVGALLQFLFVAKTCAEMENAILDVGPNDEHGVRPYLVQEQAANPPNLPMEGLYAPDYDELIAFVNLRNHVTIRFGRQNLAENGQLLGNVEPTCGDLSFRLSDPRPTGEAEVGVEVMQRYYFYIIQELYFNIFTSGNIIGGTAYGQNYPLNYYLNYFDSDEAFVENLPENAFKQDLQSFYTEDLKDALNDSGATGFPLGGSGAGAVMDMSNSARWTLGDRAYSRGWAGAAVVIPLIAEMNGAMTTAVLNVPMPIRYPATMEFVYAQKRKYDQNMSFTDRFNPLKGNDKAIQAIKAGETNKQNVLWQAFDYFQRGDSTTTPHTTPSGAAVIDIINTFLGTSGLYSMRKNVDVHPIAQLTGLGKSLVEGGIRNLTYAAIGGISGAGLAAISENFLGATADMAANLLLTFAMIGLTAGFILFYIVPMLPFLYFFFAMSGWVKAIFEAMVGAPLWALAHIRISGEGLAGQAGVSGYFLILEIFLRPILMIFGLLASISIFSALVSVLNQIFDIVTHNVGGFDIIEEYTGEGGEVQTNQKWINEMRGPVDKFFFTVIYAIIVYMIGMSCFKLVDILPNNILRWMGQSVSAFGDQREDMGQSIVGTSSTGTQQGLSALKQAMEKPGGGG
jgi:conjugal transfer/type IV secretion protein DotA/TraY